MGNEAEISNHTGPRIAHQLAALRIGIHTSRSGALDKAAFRAAELGANTFQIFSASPRMWRSEQPQVLECRRFREARERFDLRPLVVHANYLINLASNDPVVRDKSVVAFRAELERSAAIGAEYVVLHPGSYRGQTLLEGLAGFVRALVEAVEGFPPGKLMLLLEHTAGAGAAIGSRFEELRALRDTARTLTRLKIGYCLDTCHLLTAGYDIASRAGLAATVQEADEVLGLDAVRIIHANDSKAPLGSKLDRHANIGEGYIGEEGFRRILAHPKLRGKPFILETPVDREGDDRRNLEKLKSLCPRSHTTITRSS